LNLAGWLAPPLHVLSTCALDDLLYLDQLVKILCCLICEKKSFHAKDIESIRKARMTQETCLICEKRVFMISNQLENKHA